MENGETKYSPPIYVKPQTKRVVKDLDITVFKLST